MPQVYLVARRSEVQNGSVMVTDLFPNESQRNTALDPQGAGPIYIRQIDAGTRGAFRSVLSATNGGADISFLREARGLVAYLLYNVQVGAAGPALTLEEATEIASLLISEVRTGGVLDLAAINAILGGVAAGATLTANTSTGSVSGLLRVLSGETYVVPAGSPIQDANVFVPDANADEIGFQRDVRHPVNGDSSWEISALEGSLAGLTAAQPNGFGGGAGTDPIVTIYNSDGTLY